MSSSLVINATSYKLVNDIPSLAIDVENYIYGAFALAGDIDAAQYGTFRHPPIRKFYGVFEGLGNTVKNLSISAKHSCERTSVGLFGVAGKGTYLRDVTILNAKVSVAAVVECNVGILVGTDDGFIENVRTTGSVIVSAGEHGNVGVLGGHVGSIKNSSSAGSVSSVGVSDNVGGLVGYGFKIERSHSSAKVNASQAVAGGLAGWGYPTACYATGDVIGAEAGGLVGSSTLIDTSFATGNVSGYAVGGLVAELNYGDVNNSYASGAVQTYSSYAGGLIGEADSQTSTVASYAIGRVTGGDDSFVDGFVGISYSDLFNSDYWDIDTSGLSVGCGELSCVSVSGLSDAQLRSGLPAGFDSGIWGQNAAINSGYPYLLANPPQ